VTHTVSHNVRDRKSRIHLKCLGCFYLWPLKGQKNRKWTRQLWSKKYWERLRKSYVIEKKGKYWEKEFKQSLKEDRFQKQFFFSMIQPKE